MSDPNDDVNCLLTEDGIEVFAFGKRYFSMPWPWIDEIRSSMIKKESVEFEILETQYGEWPEVERPQAEFGLRGYSQF